MRRPGVIVVATAVAALVVGGMVACSDAMGDGSGERASYVTAFAEVAEAGDPTASPDEARCIAEATVDTLGVEDLREVTPREVRDGRSIRPPDLGLAVDEDDGVDFYERLGDCMDVRDYLVDASAGAEDAVSDEVQACVRQGFGDDLVRRIVVDSFVNPSGHRDPAVQSDVQAVFQSCAGA
jgi:hypothetical protein